MLRGLLALLLVLTASPSFAANTPASANLPDGTYLTERGWGQLTLGTERDGQHFGIDVLGTNFHTCTLTGTVQGLVATPHDGDEEEGSVACILALTPTEQGISVEPQGGDAMRTACRAYCGARAYFAGEYKNVPSLCTPAAVSSQLSLIAVRDRADELPFARKYLNPILEKCSNTLPVETEQDLRAAMALANHHAGRNEDCGRLLEVYDEWLAQTDAQIREAKSYAPSEAEQDIAQSKKLRDIKNLCKLN